jgi:plastocyanin
LVRVLVAFALILGLVLATAGTAVAAAKVVKAVDGNKFQPVHKYIYKGQKIKWVNKDNIKHNVKATDKKKDWNYKVTLSPGESAIRKFGKTGNYHYKCTLHPGMEGYIHVKKP